MNLTERLRDPETMRRWWDQIGIDAAKRIEDLEKRFGHYFVTPDKSTEDPWQESCKQCGLNLRDGVHFRVQREEK